MFRTKQRQTLRIPMGLFDDPTKDPIFEIQYLLLAKRQQIIASHTTTTYHPMPAGVVSDKPYIEKTVTDDNAIVAEIVGACVVGWEHVCDDETGEPIPFDKKLLLSWIREGEEVYLWFATKLPGIFREFDALINAQQDTIEKN